MQLQRVVLPITLCLASLLLACSSKPAEQAAQEPTAESQSAQTTPPQAEPAASETSTPAKPAAPAKTAAVMPALPKPKPGHTTPATLKQPVKAAAISPISQSVVVPAGTELTVRLTQELSSKTNQAGDAFSATLSQPVQIEGKTVIPAGTQVAGKVVDVASLGRFKGGAKLQLALDSITIAGHEHAIQTSNFSMAGKGKGTRTAGMIGGGGAVGALIGGLAGGGKGAAIGAIAGAGAGTAGAGLTGNQDIVLPAEAALSFKMEQPLEIKQ